MRHNEDKFRMSESGHMTKTLPKKAMGQLQENMMSSHGGGPTDFNQ